MREFRAHAQGRGARGLARGRANRVEVYEPDLRNIGIPADQQVAAVEVGVDEPGCEQALVKFDRRA